MGPGDVCVVTGGNAGIGKEVAWGLLQRGGHVVLACRSPARCQEARRELLARLASSEGASSSRAGGGAAAAAGGDDDPNGTRCECAELDLSDFGSVRRFSAAMATRLRERFGGRPLALLVNNAGAMGLPR